MALIGKIRKNSWLLIILIGLGLASFILMDMFSGNNGMGGGQELNIGSVNGEEISWNEFQSTESVLYRNAGGDAFNRRKALWDYFVENKLITEEAEALGLSVSKEELMDLQFGPNVSPIIQQSFRNPQTGQLDRNRLNEFKTAIEDNSIAGDGRRYWAIQENQIIKDRLETKLATMVTKALYTPTWMVEQTHIDQNQKMDFNFVKIPYDAVKGNVSVSDQELKTYLNENAVSYIQKEEARKVEYLTYNVTATKADSMAVREQLMALNAGFQSTAAEDLTDYTANNFGSYRDAYVKKSDLTTAENITNQLFANPVGSIVGPYKEGNSYKLAKIVERHVLPDSAKSRHILIQATTPAQFTQAQVTIDSIRNLIETGAMPFDSLAIKHSQDGGSASKGGVYENVAVNQFVPEYRDIIFRTGEIGKLYTARTSYGIHLIEPMGRTLGNNETWVKVAYLSQAIIPSEETQNNVYDEAYKMITSNDNWAAIKKAAAGNSALSIETSPAVQANDFIIGTLGGGQASRDMIRWAFNENTEIGMVSPEVYSYQDPVNYYTNKYVVASLNTIQAAGMPALADVKDLIEPIVLNDKKAASLKSSLQGKSLADVAAMYSTEVENVTQANFNASNVAGIGNEPKVVAGAFNLDANQVSDPIAGANGVFVVQMVNKPALATKANVPQMRQLATNRVKTQIKNGLMNSIRKHAEVTDNRATFY